MIKLDEFDKKLLNEAQKKDACIPKIALIAKRLNKPRTTIYQRLQKLKKDGMILGYSAEVDSKNVGKEITAYMLGVAEHGKDVKEIAKNLCKIPCVQEVHFVTGDWDFLIKAKVSTIEEYYNFSAAQVMQTHGIVRTMGLIVPQVFKEESKINL